MSMGVLMDHDLSASSSAHLLDEQTLRCRRLWAQVLVDAVRVYLHWLQRGAPKPMLRRVASELAMEGSLAERWIFRTDRHGVGSFEWVCDVLELDPAVVRTQMRLKAQEITGRLHARSVRLAQVAGANPSDTAGVRPTGGRAVRLQRAVANSA